MPDPNIYATFYVQGTKHCLLRNDQDQEILITAEAAGDVAIMLADFCRDPELAEFVADSWSGRSWDLKEFPEDDDEESDDLLDQSPETLDEVDENPHAIGADRYHPDESRIDLGGGMVVPLAELTEDDG